MQNNTPDAPWGSPSSMSDPFQFQPPSLPPLDAGEVIPGKAEVLPAAATPVTIEAGTSSGKSDTEPAASVPEDKVNAPTLPLGKLFWMFLQFGLRAWGGPVAQMAMLKQQLVVEGKWISVPRFNRVVAVYQVLPGPEATELCCYFGMLSRGRIGAVLGGLGFVLPGFVLMLLSAWVYQALGEQTTAFILAFRALQPAVTAMVFRAVHKIGDHAFQDPVSHQYDWKLGVCGLIAAIESVANVNFFITLVHCGILYGIFLKYKRNIAGAIWAVVPLIIFAIIIIKKGPLTDLIPMGVGAGALGRNPGTSFLVGLLGGLLTFGGAYTAIPLMQYESVTVGHWLTQQQFLDGIAIGQILPSPLVIFSTFVGFLSSGVLGSILMTIGMFLPAFSFTLIGHDYFERVVESQGYFMHVLDGVSAAVVGLIAVTGVQILKSAIVRPVDSIIFMASLAFLYQSKSKYAPIAVVTAAALAGVVLSDAGLPPAGPAPNTNSTGV